MQRPAKALFHEFCQKHRLDPRFSVEQRGRAHQPTFRCVLTCAVFESETFSSPERSFTADKRNKKVLKNIQAPAGGEAKAMRSGRNFRDLCFG